MNLRDLLGDNAAGGSDALEFAVDSNAAITLHFVASEDDVARVAGRKPDGDLPIGSVSPTFTHQIFENEKIFGYKGLRIDVYICTHTFFTLVEHSYDTKIDDENLGSSVALKADDVVGMIGEWLAEDGWTTSRGAFIDHLNVAQDGPSGVPGVLKGEYTIDNDAFEVYATTFPNKALTTFQTRMQTLVIWFIDGGCHLDLTDDNWEFMHIYRKGKRRDQGTSHECIGFVSVYRLWSYPEHIRKRLSQMLILPEFQRMGHGRRLLEGLYADNEHVEKLRDITVEDPSDEFKLLRDTTDGVRCKRLAEFSGKLSGDKEMVERALAMAHGKLKLYKRQARRIYEVLWLLQIDMTDPDMYKNYRLSIKQRLLHDCQETLGELEGQARKDKLAELYNEREADYRQLGERLRHC